MTAYNPNATPPAILINGKPDQGLNEVEPGSEVSVMLETIAGVRSAKLGTISTTRCGWPSLDSAELSLGSFRFTAPEGRGWSLWMRLLVNGGIDNRGAPNGSPAFFIGCRKMMRDPYRSKVEHRVDLVARAQALVTCLVAVPAASLTAGQVEWVYSLADDIGVMPPVPGAPVDLWVRAGLDLMRRLLA